MAFSKKIIVFISIISLLGNFWTYPAYATDVFASVKFGLDTAAKAAAQGAFRAITNKILDKVRTGGIAGALFVQDWREFQLRAQYRGEDVWRGMLYFAANGGNGIPPILCDHIRNSTAFQSLQPQQINNAGLLALQRRYDSLQDVFVTLKCDSAVEQRIGIYKQDFVQGGGWDTFARMLSAQNRPEGATAILINELEKQRKIEELAALNEGKAGSGYTGIRECLANSRGPTCDNNVCSNGVGPCRTDSDCGGQPQSACTVLGRIKTPGSTIGEQVTSIFDTNLKFYTTADAASLAIAAFTEFLVGKLIDEGITPDASSPTVTGVGPGESFQEIEKTYFAEFCSARDNMSTVPTARYIYGLSQLPPTNPKYNNAYQMFPPEEDINSGDAKNDNDVGKSYCKYRYDRDDNKDPFGRCMRACHQKLGLTAGTNLIGPEYISPAGTWWDAGGVFPTPPDGGTGVCRDPSDSIADYGGALQDGIDQVNAENPNGIADALNTSANSLAYLNEVARAIRTTGLNSTTEVLNGNDNPNSGDLIAIWADSDEVIERYDAVIDAGAGNLPMRDAAISDQFTGDIPLSCNQ